MSLRHRLALKSLRTNILFSQGWSLVGVDKAGHESYFISWDGSTDDSQGPFILPLASALPRGNCQAKSLHSAVMPLMSYVRYAEKMTESFHHSSAFAKPPSATTFGLPSFLRQDESEGGFSSGFCPPQRSFSITLRESIKVASEIEGGIDDILINALDSISTPYHQSPEARAKTLSGGRSSRSKSLVMSHQEKSKRILRQCSSWTQLDDTKANRGNVHGQGE